MKGEVPHMHIHVAHMHIHVAHMHMHVHVPQFLHVLALLSHPHQK